MAYNEHLCISFPSLEQELSNAVERPSFLDTRAVCERLKLLPLSLAIRTRAQVIAELRLCVPSFHPDVTERHRASQKQIVIRDDRIVEIDRNPQVLGPRIHRNEIPSVTFFPSDEQRIVDNFLHNGYVIAPAEDAAALNRIRDLVVAQTVAFLGSSVPLDPQEYLETIGQRLPTARLNDLRLTIMNDILATPWFHTSYFACGRTLLQTLVGNELAMQRGLGLSVQLPGDESSVLPLHSDVWSEDSPFEIVLWLPLVDCFGTKRMFLLPPEADDRWRDRISEYQSEGVEALFQALESELLWIDIKYGEVLVFTHTLMHGNRFNAEATARWSMNIRFKGLFTPYADKRLGEFFVPITLRPASRIGMRYRLPVGFDD